MKHVLKGVRNLTQLYCIQSGNTSFKVFKRADIKMILIKI